LANWVLCGAKKFSATLSGFVYQLEWGRYLLNTAMDRPSLLLTAALMGTIVSLVQPVAQAKSFTEVQSIARAVTVEIRRQQQNDNGSGIIIQKQGDLYTLVTNRHVICGGGDCSSIPVNEVFTIELPDGQQYKVPHDSIKLLGSSDNIVDLAIMQFHSNRNYAVTKLATPGSLKIDDQVYASGFPCERNSVPDIPCQPLGYAFDKGRAIAVVNKRLTGDNGGYTITYNATTLPGMSGGGVFNSSGQLVAIHGYGDRYKDNSLPDEKHRIDSKAGLNRGIPIVWLVRNLAEVGITLATAPFIYDIRATHAQVPATADEYFITGFNKFIEPGDDVIAGKKQAIQEFSTAIRLNPRYQFAYIMRASTYNQIQEFQQSLADYNQAILLNPKFSSAYNSRGVLKNEKLNDTQGALTDFNQAIILNPKFSSAYNNRASLKNEKLNDIQGSLTDYNQAILLNPKFSAAYSNRGILKYTKLNDIQGALGDYNQAILLNPKISSAYNSRANLKNERLNDIQGAMADYNQAILLDQKFSSAYNNRGILKNEKLNDIQGALADYNQAILLNPKYSAAYYNRASLKYTKLNDIQGSLTDYNQAILLDQKDFNAYNNRGILKNEKLNDMQGALADFNQAILLNPKYSAAYYNRASLKYTDLNDRAGAIQDFRQAARLFREQGNTQNLQRVIEALQQLGATE
jgi:tetratricopeptide (TPR) repeat protein